MYLDPHTVQPTVNVTDPCHIPDQTYHCPSPDRMSITDLDPSIALGFFCKDEEDLDDLIRRLKSVRKSNDFHLSFSSIMSVGKLLFFFSIVFKLQMLGPGILRLPVGEAVVYIKYDISACK